MVCTEWILVDTFQPFYRRQYHWARIIALDWTRMREQFGQIAEQITGRYGKIKIPRLRDFFQQTNFKERKKQLMNT